MLSKVNFRGMCTVENANIKSLNYHTHPKHGEYVISDAAKFAEPGDVFQYTPIIRASRIPKEGLYQVTEVFNDGVNHFNTVRMDNNSPNPVLFSTTAPQGNCKFLYRLDVHA